MSSVWKNAGLTYSGQLNLQVDCPSRYLQYVELCSRIVRYSLKDEFRAAAVKRGEQGLKYAKWSKGKQGELKAVNPLPSQSNP